MTKQLTSRSKPVQHRAHKQRDNILKVTSELLKTAGIDELTTILVAKEAGISVGTLYHYFPNKHAILYALSELWVDKIGAALAAIESENIEDMKLKPFVNLVIARVSEVYDEYSSLLPLVETMNTTPDLVKIRDDYSTQVKTSMVAVLLRLSISLEREDATHLAGFYWPICHSILVQIATSQLHQEKSLADLKFLLLSLLERARDDF